MRWLPIAGNRRFNCRTRFLTSGHFGVSSHEPQDGVYTYSAQYRFFPFCALTQDANVLVFPDLQSGNLAVQALRQMGEAVAIGRFPMGTRRPVHVVQYGFSVEDVVKLATVGAVEAAS